MYESDSDDSAPEDEADEDSNAEDNYRNDYPDEEESEDGRLTPLSPRRLQLFIQTRVTNFTTATPRTVTEFLTMRIQVGGKSSGVLHFFHLRIHPYHLIIPTHLCTFTSILEPCHPTLYEYPSPDYLAPKHASVRRSEPRNLHRIMRWRLRQDSCWSLINWIFAVTFFVFLTRAGGRIMVVVRVGNKEVFSVFWIILLMLGQKK